MNDLRESCDLRAQEKAPAPRLSGLGWRRVRVVVLAMACLMAPRAGLAQDVTEGVLKGAFLYNFAKFTEWPSDVLPVGAPLVACVIGDQSVADALARNARGRLVGGHSVLVTTGEKGLQRCNLLYLASGSTQIASQALITVAHSPVLTISDVDEFARTGGIAQFFVQGGKMRFRVNLSSMKRSHLQLSAPLLSLAELVNE